MDDTLVIVPATKICSGSWTLYSHPQEETKWGINTFIKIGTMTTWKDFWSIINALNTDNLPEGMFFLMRDPVLPLWENHQNIKGGWYSFCVPKETASNSFVVYSISAMLQKTQKNDKNNITGISISPKKRFNVIKIWNSDAKLFNKPSDICTFIPTVNTGSIQYTPFLQKKM